MPIGNSPEVLSQRILAGIVLVGRLGVREFESANLSEGDWPQARLCTYVYINML